MNTATASKIELRIPARPEFLSLVRLAVAAIGSQMDFDFDAIEDVKTGVSEACNNAIQHASGADREIQIVFSLQTDQLMVEVRDAGAGFDLSSYSEVDLDTIAAEDLPDSGFGLLLMRNLMDEFDCLSQPGAGTLVRMVKRCSRPA